ncbi:MAG: molybdopterin molybdotransferase MoeA, partial [Burkholderiaceae bacterium]
MTASESKPSAQASRPLLMSLDDALAALLAHAEPIPATDSVATMDADGRVLAQDVLSPLQVPPADNSSMDGYAVRSADLRAGDVELPVSQRIAAGATGAPLAAGSAARIFTGAQIPPGADAVVMQEDTAVAGEGRVRINVAAPPGQWIRRAGEDVTLGARVLARGDRLTPASVGMAACVGLAELFVAVRPKVALFSTGDELVMPGEVAPSQLKAGSIYNSNRFFLRALLKRLNCDVTDLGIVPDRRDATIAAIKETARGHDLILTSGGVSVGEEDHVKPAVEALGRLDLWQIAMKPGKPFAYGTVGNNCHFIGL